MTVEELRLCLSPLNKDAVVEVYNAHPDDVISDEPCKVFEVYQSEQDSNIVLLVIEKALRS